MIEQNVQVMRCSDEQLWVRMGSRTGCTACDNGMGCGAGLFAKLIQRKPVILELARKDIEVEAGQMLTLAFPEQLYLKLVIASYGWPLLAALAGAFAGYSAAAWMQLSPVVIDVVTLTSGVLLAWVVLRLISSRKAAETILNSLSMTVCVPSSTPNMCTGRGKNRNVD
jgi:positive regulator of sigma E activity